MLTNCILPTLEFWRFLRPPEDWTAKNGFFEGQKMAK
jgi:hypothetical protein